MDRVAALASAMTTSESTFQILKNTNNAKHLNSEVVNLISDLESEVDIYIRREVERITSSYKVNYDDNLRDITNRMETIQKMNDELNERNQR